MKRLLCYFVSTSCLAAINVPLTVQEALYSGSTTGIARSNEAVTVGVPLPDSAGIASTNGLGLSGATAAQFVVEGTWPSGNIKWLKIRAIVPSVPAGGTAAMTLTSSGSGNFGGANLAVDNGATITVSTGTAVFTIRKANFNVVDQVSIGSTQVVQSGASQGLVILGPNPTATYPGNVTCAPSAGGTPCTSVYASANDPNSTATIEENGPAVAVIKATGDHVDNASHVYMHYTARLYFYQNKSYVKVTSILRNADYGVSHTFATAYKGIQGYELRVSPNLGGTLAYTIGNHTTTATTGTLNQAGGTDYAYIYQAESGSMKPPSWCGGAGCVAPSPLSGYSIVANGSAVTSGTSVQIPQGWADIRDANGVGVEIGQYQFGAYGNKSLEFRGGGTDVRVGMWAAENNTTGTSATTANAPYYIPYPQYSINDVYLMFHGAASTSPANEFLQLQHNLLARAAVSYYNSTGVFMYPLLDTTEESTFYTNAVSTASPAVNNFTFADLGVTDTFNFPLSAYRFYSWPQGGAGNQMEFHASRVYNFLRRGHTGEYLDTVHFYKMVSELSFPRSDGFDWRNKSGSETIYLGYPTAARDNSNLGMDNWIELAQEHAHWYGMPEYYFISGDETIKEAIIDGPADSYLNTVSGNNLISTGRIWDARAAGTVLMGTARLHNFFQTIGDNADAAAVLARGATLWTLQIQPDLCASGYPAGCVPDLTGTDSGAYQRGTSKLRGITFQWGDTSFNSAGCSFTTNRTFTAFMTGIMLQGMWELRQEEGPAWGDYNAIFDTGYGITQGALGEMYLDNNTSSWGGNGFRYKEAIDYANSCAKGTGDFTVMNPDAYWPIWYFNYQYLGQGTSGWQRKVTQNLQSVFGSGTHDELYHYTIGNLIYLMNHGNSTALSTVPITGFSANGSSYTITWNVPAGAASYRIKWGPKQIVDWIGFDSANNVFIGDPVNTMNWFTATDATGIPAPSGTTQSLVINTGVTGLTAANFMVKAYATGGAPPAGDTTPPTASLTAPANAATLSGTVTLSATAADNVGVASLQFNLDGFALGAPIAGGGPYTSSWNTTTVSNGSHTLSATAKDAAGNVGTSATVSITVNNTVAPPAISAVSAGAILSSTATITWSSSTLSDSQAAYGTTTAYGSTTPLDGTLVLAHTAILTGLTGSTTYHFKVMSRDAQGNLSSSGDLTFTTTAVNTGGGGAIPTGTWTTLSPTGAASVEAMGFDKSAYISSRKISCYLGSYKQFTTSEANNAIVCYSYAENRWTVLQSSGYWHSSHAGQAGHSQSAFAYDSNRDTILYTSDGAGASQPADGFYGHFWQHDVSGLSGREKEVANMAWMGANGAVSAFTYDSFDQKLLSWNSSKTLSVYDPVTNTMIVPSASGSIPSPSDTNVNLVYNGDDHKSYLYGGYMTPTYAVQCNTAACTAVTWTQLTTTCSGPNCSGANPPLRSRAAMAYSTKDHVFLVCAGLTGSGAGYTDTWILDPVAKTWTQVTPSATYSNPGNANTPYDKLTYDSDSNVFILITNSSGYSAGVSAFPYTAAANYGRNTVTNTIPTGTMNRNTSAAGQSWAFDPAVTGGNGQVFTGWVETGADADNSTCGSAHHPLAQALSGGVWTQYGGCTSISPEAGGSEDSSKLKLAYIGGALWEAHEASDSPAGFFSSAYARSWNGTAWAGGQVGCFTGSCGAGSAGKYRQYPAALIGNNGTPTLAVIEADNTTYGENQYLYVAQYSGGTWNKLGAGFLNVNGATSGTRANSAALATDGTNPAACWSEERVDPNTRAAILTPPQIRCAQWNGSTWAGFGASALNQSTANWAYDPAITYMGGNFYLAWVERTTAGNNLLYACKWNGSSCALLGGGAVNMNVNGGWAAHPSLDTDGTNLYLAWEEQAGLNQHSLGYVKQWNGTSWVQIGGVLAADPSNGSVEGISLAVANGAPTAIWGELSYGNLRQVYAQQWNGTAWQSINGPIAPPAPAPATSPCDLNSDGVVDSKDVQIAINQALGVIACTNALQSSGQCNVISVQRVIDASLGGACKTTP